MSTLRTLSKFHSRLQGGGARPNLFEVRLDALPDAALNSTPGATWGQQGQEDFAILCKAANLPASTIASIDVPFRGRTFKVAGDRTIDPWTITVINDEDFRLRRAFEEWSEQIAKLDNNLGATDPGAYMVNAKVYQLGRGSTASSKDNAGSSNAVLAEYQFVDIFPTNVSQIDLSYDSTDTIEEFTVEFQVQSFNILEPKVGAAAPSPNG